MSEIEEQIAKLYLGDSIRVADVLGADSIDAIVTDPPAGIGFMSKGWDTFKGARAHFIAEMQAIFTEALRVLKPGGHALIWALPRTSHWTATAVEDAGFEIRDVVDHIFGSGFPKSLDVAREIEMKICPLPGRHYDETLPKGAKAREGDHLCPEVAEVQAIFGGRGTALKPAKEHWILARKPLAGTVAANVQKYGTGALNIDGCRIATTENLNGGAYAKDSEGRHDGDESWRFKAGGAGGYEQPAGRFPANVILSHAENCRLIGTREVKTGIAREPVGQEMSRAIYGKINTLGRECSYGTGGKETVEAWDCAPDCAVAELDRQSGESVSRKGKPRASQAPGDGWGMQATGAEYTDKGGASRFFYVAKPSTSERDAGCEHLPPKTGGEATDREDGSDGLKSPRAGAGRGGGRRNHHPTVKSIALMRYLCRLITPPGGVVLDLFAGSGSTGVAAVAEGFHFIGFEREPEYIEIAKARIEHAMKKKINVNVLDGVLAAPQEMIEPEPVSPAEEVTDPIKKAILFEKLTAEQAAYGGRLAQDAEIGKHYFVTDGRVAEFDGLSRTRDGILFTFFKPVGEHSFQRIRGPGDEVVYPTNPAAGFTCPDCKYLIAAEMAEGAEACPYCSTLPARAANG